MTELGAVGHEHALHHLPIVPVLFELIGFGTNRLNESSEDLNSSPNSVNLANLSNIDQEKNWGDWEWDLDSSTTTLNSPLTSYFFPLPMHLDSDMRYWLNHNKL